MMDKSEQVKYRDRYGRFSIMFEFWRRFPDQCKKIMGECSIIVDARLNREAGTIDYIAICDKFEHTDADEVPMYEWGLVKVPDFDNPDPAAPPKIELTPRKFLSIRAN